MNDSDFEIHRFDPREPLPPPKVRLGEDCFMVEMYNYNDTYDIEFSRCKNITQLLWWIHHLCETVWMDTTRVNDLIEVVAQKIGIKMYEGEG